MKHWREILLFLLIVAVTIGAAISYSRGDSGWRRHDEPRPGVSTDR